MSHFGVLILADEVLDRAGAEEYAARVLARYDENREVDEHEVDCWCVGSAARQAACEEVDPRFAEERERRREAFTELQREVLAASHGEIEHAPLYETGVALLPASKVKDELQERSDAMDAEWEAFVARRNAAEKEAEKAHPAYGKPEPDCETCEGTGRHRTTENPEGFWDWWVIGGRWTGVLDPDYDPSTDPRNFAACWLCHGTGKRTDMEVLDGCNACQGTGVARNWSNAPHDRDVLPLAEVDEENVVGHFYAAVTPDGEWHQQGRMGWFGMSSDDMSDATWADYIRTLLRKHPDATVIVCDCHI